MKKGRPREFDREHALEQAMRVFWLNGYRGASLDDLTGAMGINRPSLYAAFGDKEKLFLESIDHYRMHFIMPVFKQLVDADKLADGLRAFFSALAKLLCGHDTPPGCFIACILTEDACASPIIRDKLESLIGSADQGFGQLLASHKSEFRDDVQVESVARLMTTMVHGLAIRARSGATENEIVEIGESFSRSVLKSAAI